MHLVSMAYRNLTRKWHRTLVTTGAMAFAGFMMIFYSALMEGLLEMTERNAVGMNLGDIQIHAEGYRLDPDLYNRIQDPEALLAKLRARGFTASGRLFGFGLAAAGSASAGIQMRGIDLEQERTVTQVDRHIQEGAWLDPGDPLGVVIGRKLARTLGVRTGDEIIVVSQASDGSIANELYRVRGILKAIGEGVDRTGLFMVDWAFRDLMVLPTGVHEIVAMREDRAHDLEAATLRVKALAPGLDVMNWRQLQPVISNVLDISKGSLIFVLLIVYAAIAMVVLNAMLMSVFERIREFGIMKAIGVSPWRLAALIYIEAMAQAAVAGVLAVAVGVPVSYYFQAHGIDLSAWSSTGTIGGVALDPIWHSRLTAWAAGVPLLYLFGVAALAVIYPTIKAAVIQPIKAIHYR